jgi:hypothetical protein
VKLLNMAHKALRLYPGASEIPRQNTKDALGALGLILEREPVVRFVVTRDGLLYDGEQTLPATAVFTSFNREFYSRNIAEVRFHSGSTEDDVLEFLTLLDSSADAIAAAGGFEAGLWERGVTTITVTEVLTRIVDQDLGEEEAEKSSPAADEEPWPPSFDRIDEMLALMAPSPRDQRLLVRVVGERALLRSYLANAKTSGGLTPDDVDLSGRVAALAQAVQFELPEDRDALLRSLAQAILDLDPTLRQKIVAKRLLSEARRDDTLAAVVRQMSLDEVMDAILHDIPETIEARSGLSRAIRNLALVNLAASRETVLEAAANKMQERGMSTGFVSAVLEGAAPSRLAPRDTVRSSDARSVESVLRLVDLAPKHGGPHVYDESIAPLRAEATRGVTDGDVVSAIVTLATLEARPEPAASLAALLEDRIELLLDQQEFEVAADAAEALTAAEQNGTVPEAHRRRMRELLKLLARPDSMRKITSAMRVYRHDTPEHAACRRLLSVLGAFTISALLEVLAEEPDMTARKALVDLISGMASRSIGELGSRVDDRRWYFVRNVVAILGTTRDPEVLQYMGRTLRHPDERVRRETIRAVAGIRHTMSNEMLIAALGDSEAHNVQLAARYLGSVGGPSVIAALERVARGEGSGNRETAPRIEAVEALGRVGGASSLRVLEELSRHRGFAARAREMRTAASSALGVLRSRGVRGD